MLKNYTVVFTSLVNPPTGVNQEDQQTAEYSYSINATSLSEARMLAKEQHSAAVNKRILMAHFWEN
jgi:hypothetical protein